MPRRINNKTASLSGKIYRKLFFLSALPVILVIIGILLGMLHHFSNARDMYSLETARLSVEIINSRFSNAHRIIRKIARIHGHYPEHSFARTVEAILPQSPFSDIHIVDSSGRISNSYMIRGDKIVPRDSILWHNTTFAGKSFFTQNAEQNRIWSPVYNSFISGEKTVSLFYPLEKGYICGDIQLAQIQEVIQKLNEKIQKDIAVIDRFGKFILSGNSAENYTNLRQLLELRQTSSAADALTYTRNSTKMKGHLLPLQDKKWYILISEPYASFIEPYLYLTGGGVFLLFFIVFILTASHYSISLWLREVFSQFQENLNNLARGEYSLAESRTGIRELDEMAAHLRKSADEIAIREKNLRRSRVNAVNQAEFQQHLIDEIPYPLYVISRNEREKKDRVILKNRACLRAFGKETTKLLQISDMEGEITAPLRDERDHHFILRKRNYSVRGSGKGQIVILIDITDRQELEEQLRHSEKLHALGQLAGGIAHDMNNQLAGIMGIAELMKMHHAPDSESEKSIDTILSAVRNSASLVQQLLAFSRQGKYRMEPISICAVVGDVEEILRHSITKKCRIYTDLPEECSSLCIRGDYSQIQNALLNLSINGADSLNNRDGSLQIRVEICTFASPLEVVDGTLPPGEYVCLNVADTGEGIPQNALSRIFEPFYTTKENGKGTGMGLAAVYGTVMNHGGGIQVTSSARGTTFSLYFPRIPCTSQKHSSAHVRKKNAPGSVASRKGQILVVDDDELMRTTLRSGITRMGYTVLTAENGLEAVSRVKEQASEIDLIILDVIMPVMDGVEAYREIRKSAGEIPVIVASGYAKEGKVQELISMGANRYISKPFSIFELEHTIAELLGEGKGPEEIRPREN
ncbi:MAG: response regulator [Fibrobacterota bacterium]